MDELVVEVARQIRPFLTELVGPRAAEELDGRIANLLEAAHNGEDTAGLLRSLLESNEATKAFLIEVLRGAPEYRPPKWQPRSERRRIAQLPGSELPMHAAKYRCPRDDYIEWYRPDVGVPIPECPTHHGSVPSACLMRRRWPR